MNSGCWAAAVCGSIAVGAGAPLTLQSVDWRVSGLQQRMDAQAKRIQDLEARVTALEGGAARTVAPSALPAVPPHAGNGWAFRVSEITRPPMHDAVKEAEELRARAKKIRDDAAKIDRRKSAANQSKVGEMMAEAAELERRARGLDAQAADPPIVLRGVDASGRIVVCLTGKELAGRISAISVEDIVRVAGERISENADELQIRATRIVEP